MSYNNPVTNVASDTLHYIGKNYSDTFVVQIGACDGLTYDDTRGFLNMYNWAALLVEPVPAIMAELQKNFATITNYKYEQSAITESDGETVMLTVPIDIVEREDLHPGYKGMSALYPLRNGFGSNYQRDIDVKSKFGVDVKVNTLTLKSLFNKHQVQKVDVFICDAEGYDWKIFTQLDLAVFRPKLIRLEYMNLTDDEKKLVVDKFEQNDYLVEMSGENIDGVTKELWDKIKNAELTTTQPSAVVVSAAAAIGSSTTSPKSDLTVVTGLWNINRVGRPFDHYIENLNKLLDIDANLFLYLPKDLEHLVWKKRTSKNTFVKIFELSDVQNMYKPFWDRTQKLRTDPAWINKAGWLAASPQASQEWYNPIVQSKMFLLNDVTIWNPFDTKHFMWLDAGITNSVYEKYFTDNRALDKIEPYLEQFLFLSYPYEANTEIHGFDFDAINRYSGKKVTYVCRGGLFGGTRESINQANSTYYSLLETTLNGGYMGTEESVFTIMSYLEPEKYRRYSLDSNGLIVKFAQALLDNKVELEPVPKDVNIYTPRKFVYPDKLKLSVYMLTFNFPHQLEHTIQTWLQHPKWITNTKNILIDNSTNEDARIANAELCKKYKFEHIINNKNDGINGGRLKAAQHFQESDSDYYVFLEDDMGLHPPGHGFCRNGFRTYVPDLYDKVLKIIDGDVDVDFLKFSYSEVYMDNNIQVSWYNVPKVVRMDVWPNYNKLPVSGLDPNCPRTKFDTIEVVDGLSYIKGDVYYANWPMIVGKRGNKKMFLDTTWAYPYEQTWMSYMFQETKKGNLKPAILLASPINHNRIAYYKPEERKENAG